MRKKLPGIWHSARNKVNGCTFIRKNSVRSSFLWFKGISYHTDNITRIPISKSGEGKQLVFVTQSAPQVPRHWLLQAAHSVVAEVRTGVQVTMGTSLFAPSAPSLQKLSNLCYLINVTLLALNWRGCKSWEFWVESWAHLSLFNKMSLYYISYMKP